MMQLNMVVVLAIVWITSFVLALSIMSASKLDPNVIEIAKMAVTGLFGIITGASAALVAMNRRSTDPKPGEKETTDVPKA